jgi:hypothetical protein
MFDVPPCARILHSNHRDVQESEMAHWLLRGRMAEHDEDGRARQERIKEQQHRPEQNKGYDEAAPGPPRVRRVTGSMSAEHHVSALS